MNYLQATAYIESLSPTTLNPSLERFAEFMRLAGNKQDLYPTIHVTGTNGKGSVVAIVDSVLNASGLKCGRFIGPHLLRWNERFHVGGEPISDSKFAELASLLRELSEDFGKKEERYGCLTWFEFLAAMAFFYFAEQKADVAVIEVGLGGRWDATNVITNPVACAITSIGLDHTHILGNTVLEIAGEKAGIIKPAVPIVTGCNGEVLSLIESVARRNQAPLIICKDQKLSGALDSLSSRCYEQFMTAKHKLALSGSYQKTNALIAASLLAAYEKRYNQPVLNALSDGFAHVFWPGRFQYFPQENILLDGAHNQPAAVCLRAALDRDFPQGRRHYVLSVYQNKNSKEMLAALLKENDIVYAAEAGGRRPVCTADEIAAMARELGCETKSFSSLEEAFSAALNRKEKAELLIGTGSFATVKIGLSSLGFKSVEESQIIK
ncbi:MAG: bifunctional folylpolyglutamate synthase/dihydrofolate synthase [Candidatus Obscuribacterales bacterium]|nr:bifunctional folylpolyglutamate synthase/dihydrofolate synthase [Candidatus Obscuribacterales bacterium]